MLWMWSVLADKVASTNWSNFLFFFCIPSCISGVHPFFLVRLLRMWLVFFCFFLSNHRGSHIPSLWMVRDGCVFVADIQLSRTWMSGSFESVRWNACVHRLDLGLYSHTKEFVENGVRTQGKNPLCWKTLRRVEPAMLHHAGFLAQHTIEWAIPALNWSNKLIHLKTEQCHKHI